MPIDMGDGPGLTWMELARSAGYAGDFSEYNSSVWDAYGNEYFYTAPDRVVQPAGTEPSTVVGAPSSGLGSGVSGGGTFGVVSPGVVNNPIFNAVGGTAVISDDVALSALRAYSRDTYGSEELGVIRRSSEVLENEPTGIRPGTMERIVIPVWARRERGSPI